MVSDPRLEIHSLDRGRARETSRSTLSHVRLRVHMVRSAVRLAFARSQSAGASQPFSSRVGLALRSALLLLLLVSSPACTGTAVHRDPDVLSMVLPRDVQELDPRYVSDAYGHKVSRLIFASLVRIEPHTLEVVPDLAESVEVLSDTEYRVSLRPALKFSDGSELDARDVVATFHSVVDPRMRTRYAPTYARIAHVEALDARHVLFTLKGPHASFLTDLEIPILRSEDAERRIALVDGPPPVGAGPYRLTSRQVGRLELRANPYWYAGAPRVPRVDMIVIRDDNTRALRLLAGAADLALNAVPPGLVPLFTPAAGFTVETADGIDTTYLGVNTEAPALKDVRVRRALAHAIDRNTLIASKFAGRAQLARSFVPPGHWAYAPQTPTYAYDPQHARALLDDSGLVAHDGSPRLKLRLRCGSDRFRVSIARAIAAMLADIGIAVTVQPTETATLISDLERGRFELTLMQVPELIEPHVLSWYFASDRIPGPHHEGSNRWRFVSSELDAALERGRRSLERKARVSAYADVQRILAEQLPVVPLWHEAVVEIRSQRVASIPVPRDGRFSTLAR